MSLREETCKSCKGGKVERLEERWLDGTWHYNGAIEPHIADAWIAEDDPACTLRWQEVDCPRCDGAGRYMVEYVQCKVF